MSLYQYIIRRLFFMIFVLFSVSIIVFAVMMMLPPGMRAAAYVNEKITPAQYDNIIRQYGLNDPPIKQYGVWIGNVFKGDLGFSPTANKPVMEAFGLYFPVTLELVLFSIPFIILTGIWLGTKGAVNKDTSTDHSIRVFAIVGYSLPTFWFGLILLMIFYGLFGLFPPEVLSNTGKAIYHAPEFRHYTHLITIDALLNKKWWLAWDALYHMILPTFNLVILNSALIMRLMRSNMLSAMGQEYVRTATAKGADRKTVITKHARKNAIIPVITISGIMFAELLAGMVITETIFSRKGIGWWMARAALQLDVSAIMFNVLFLAVIFVMMNLVVDIVNAALDPRIRLS